jgi:hypothetical protein
MAKKRKGDELRRHEQVVAAADMPGVPAGTKGKVTLVNGFAWIRYRVYFENGADIGSLDRAQLVPEDEWEGVA